ncbi:hypothetical protein, partial [Caldisphaera sp.]|uniref:hypothetical protein n=1 Tax=Caldisphaera sp. TaxID=2060322 RepID=UPI003D11D9B2
MYEFFKSSIFSGNGLNIFTYFSGIPWYDSNAHVKPLVSAAVALSYVAGNPGTDNASDILNVGGNTCLPLDYPIVMFEYGWADCLSGPGPGCSSGYYVGIPVEYTCTYQKYYPRVGLQYYTETYRYILLNISGLPPSGNVCLNNLPSTNYYYAG